MGFWDSVGEVLGKMTAQAQEIQQYKTEYEFMTDQELKREYRDLKSESGQECRLRLAAVKSILHDRGYGQ